MHFPSTRRIVVMEAPPSDEVVKIAPDRFYTSRQVADLIGITVRTLDYWRYNGRGPKATYLHETAHPRFRGSDLLDFLKNAEQASAA